MGRHALAPLGVLAALGAIAGCDSPGGSAGDLGIAGASCVRTPDCASPLQCLGSVCTAVGGQDTTLGAADTATPEDTWRHRADGTPDIVTDYDASDWEITADTGPRPTPDVNLGDSRPFDDCGDLGVASSWVGQFYGDIDYDLTAPAILNIPPTGVLPVDGELSFDIDCVESKFIVSGLLDGTATVVGQGDFPFRLNLRGTYDPVRRALNARMVDGSVTIYEVIQVFFEGDFPGSLQANGDFAGTWDGYSTGTNQEVVTGTAEGDGLWGASPAP